ncbi:type VI secretion system Vgr family protein [Paraburkholderia pallida]|nr:type VI secretion system Vgr family protein [Paraburkholderia pallida]
MWPDYVCTLRNYFSPVRMRGPELPERVVVLEWRKRQKEFRQDVLLPRRVWGTEAIGQLFEYHIEAYCSVHDPKYFGNDDYEIDLDAIKGTQITLIFSDAYEKEHRRYWPLTKRDRTGEREISGMVESAEIASAEGDALVYQFVIRPWWWRATLCMNSRVFVGMDAAIPNILRNVLSKYSNDIEFRFNQGLDPRHNAFRRAFIRQAWETDWDFCMRLCEEFGYLVWFEHHDEKHVLVIADNTRGCQEQSLPYDTLEYRPEGGHHQRVHIADLSWRTSVAVEKITVTDHSYISPRLSRNSLSYRAQYSVKGEDESQTNFHGRLQSYEPAEYAQPDTYNHDGRDAEDWEADAQHLARVKLEAQRGQRKRVRGRGELSGLEIGKTFALTDHPYDNANGDYLVLACKLDIRGAPGPSELFLHYSFDASFELHPKDEPYRMPQVTERPRLRDKEYAVIVGSADFEMTIDEYNRVRIQYAWDRQGDFNGRNSIWVRVAQPWQGNQMGTVMHGRHGQQVIVDYINGDPDRPIVTAFVPDVNNMPAWKLPKNQALTGIVTRSLGRGATTNHLAFDDTLGRQQVQLASDHAKSSLSLGYITRIEGNAGRQEARGEGFELNSVKAGVLRSLGMYISTFVHGTAGGMVKEMRETVARLTQARQQHEDLSQLAARHQAQTPESGQNDVTSTIKAQNEAIRGDAQTSENMFPELSRPDIVLASAAGIATSADDSTHMASRRDHAITAGRDASVSSGRSFFVAAREAISMFAYQLGLKLVAAYGNVEIKAQNDGIDATANKDVNITSENGTIYINAKRVVITAGGSRLAVGSEGLQGFTSADFLVHAASHATDGPVSVPSHLAQIAPYPMQISCAALTGAMSSAVGPADHVLPAPPANVPAPAPAPAPATAANLLPAAGTATPFDAGTPTRFEPTLVGTPEQSGSTSAQTIPVVDTTIEPCQRTLRDIPKSTVTWDMESGNYWGVYADGSPWLDPTTKKQKFVRYAGSKGTFNIVFDAASKTITMQVIVLVVPMRVRKVDPRNPKIIDIVPYESGRDNDPRHADSFMKEPRPAKAITNLPEMKSEIEKFLNKNKYKLTIKKCPKSSENDGESSCATQVTVKFVIDFVTDAKEAHHAQVNLYPLSERADAANWGELNVQRDDKDTKWIPIPNEHVQQHETGHLFSFPDEYYDQGGAVYKEYIDKQQQIDLVLAVASPDKGMWQGIGRTTLMGPGVYTPGVKVPSYYLNRVRDWFGRQTGWDWKIIPHIEA